MLNIDFLKSGSKGNCIIVDEIIMLDCGVAYELIKDRLPKVKVIFGECNCFSDPKYVKDNFAVFDYCDNDFVDIV